MNEFDLINNFLLAQIHALLDLNFFPTLSNKALRYFVCESSRKKLDEFKYSLIIILIDKFGLYINS